jgi:nucleoside-diphosphate-sugar epimerase
MILLTGATGFIGQALAYQLDQQNRTVIAAVRHPANALPASIQQITVGDMLPDTDWTQSLTKADTVIHLAARAHIMSDTAADPLAEFRFMNTAITLNLARQAAAAGVRRFIFLSSVKVNGEFTQHDQSFTAADVCHPDDPYAVSKYEAEQGLKDISKQTGMKIVIIRPPLVYGPGVKGNFLSMMRWLHKGIPLPLGAVHNQRSLVALGNLIDLITICIDHPAAANQTFLVSDGEDLSTTELLQRLGAALGRPARLLPVPQPIIETALNLLGKRAIAQRLCGNLQIDISQTCDRLGWTPPVSVDQALRQTAQAYLQNTHHRYHHE